MTSKATPNEHSTTAHHNSSNSHDAGHGTLKGYLVGFVLSVVLTALPFWIVMGNVFDSKLMTVAAIMLFGTAQIVVHMIYFLHMNTKAEGGWMIMALIFTIIVVAIALVGSLWVMYHLNTNMMPMSPEQMRNMP